MIFIEKIGILGKGLCIIWGLEIAPWRIILSYLTMLSLEGIFLHPIGLRVASPMATDIENAERFVFHNFLPNMNNSVLINKLVNANMRKRLLF